VYDVSSRESFEALPRWLEELENYVPPEVVKIVVGNKLDKVINNRTMTDNITIYPILSYPKHHPTYSSPQPFPLRFSAGLLTAPFQLGILPTGANRGGRGVRRAHGVPLRRGVRQDGRGRDRGIQRCRRAHHRYAVAVARGEDQGVVGRRGGGGVCQSQGHHHHRCCCCSERSARLGREYAGEYRLVAGAGRGGVRWVLVLAARSVLPFRPRRAIVKRVGPGLFPLLARGLLFSHLHIPSSYALSRIISIL